MKGLFMILCAFLAALAVAFGIYEHQHGNSMTPMVIFLVFIAIIFLVLTKSTEPPKMGE